MPQQLAFERDAGIPRAGGAVSAGADGPAAAAAKPHERPPAHAPLKQDFLAVQDEMLSAEAAKKGLKSVAFCCISTGEFHFPNDLAAKIAVQTVQEFLSSSTSVLTYKNGS